MPVRSSIQSAMVWPTPSVHALILDIISLQAPRLDHVRVAVGKLVLHVKASVLAYLEIVVVKTLRRCPRHETAVYIVDSTVTWAQHLTPIREPAHRAAQVGAVVAHNV